MASRKGIFVLNAAGNDGSNSWHYIGVPGDADSICTVGAVNGSGVHAAFSSVGPTADGRIKPDLSSMGEGSYVCAPGYSFQNGNGTSYATPLLAGAVACLWQAHPNRTNFDILKALKATATQSTTPDNNYGWGIPNVCLAHDFLNLNTGIQEKQKSEFELFPNPVSNQLFFNLNQSLEFVAVTDLLGKQVNFNLNKKGDGKYVIDFNNDMSSGVYFITIKTNLGLTNRKFIKD
jgi:hypothetical protein